MRNLERPLSALLCLVLLLLPLAVSLPANAFTQSGVTISFMGNGVPMGHEWLTRRAAIEVLLGPNEDPVVPDDPKDPRYYPIPWTRGMATNLDLSKAQSEVKRIKGLTYSDSRYASTYKPVFDSIIGERWVDADAGLGRWRHRGPLHRRPQLLPHGPGRASVPGLVQSRAHRAPSGRQLHHRQAGEERIRW